MKKFFIVLGSIFLALIVLGAIGIAVLAVRGTALDKEAKAYADKAIPVIVTTWNLKELLDRASPEFNQATTVDQLNRLFRRFFSSLGRLQKCEPVQGNVNMEAGKITTGVYQAKATFEKGEATINLNLIKHGNQWQIGGFRVDSSAFDVP